MESTFGDLRSLLQRPHAKTIAEALRAILLKAHATIPEQYKHEWLPYLQEFELPLFQVSSPEELAQLHPILPNNAQYALSLVDGEQDNLLQWVNQSDLPPFSSATFSFCKLEDNHIEALIDNPQFHHLSSIDFSGSWIGKHWQQPLFQSPLFRSLRRLGLGFVTWQNNNDFHHSKEQTFELMIEHIPLHQLTMLNLCMAEPENPTTWTDFAQRGHFNQLEDLHLYSIKFDPAHVDTFLDTRLFPKLKSLDFGSNHLGPDGAGRLAASSALSTIEKLEINFCKIEGNGLASLFKSPYLTQLRHLSIDMSNIGDCGLEAIEHATHITQLEELHLQRNTIGDAGLEALARSEHMGNLRHLDLRANKNITSQGIAALAAAKHITKLNHLDVEQNKIDSAGIIALAQAEHMSSLRHLELDSNQVDDEGLSALARSPHITQLNYLDLNNNPITTAGIRALANSTNASDIEELGLSNNNLDDEALVALSSSKTLSSLKVLRWNKNGVSDKGFTALVHASFFPNLTALRLEYGSITNAGMKALRSLNKPAMLEKLTLFGHNFNMEGAEALAACQMPNLKELDLRQTNINSRGLHLLNIAEGLPSLKEIETDLYDDDDY